MDNNLNVVEKKHAAVIEQYSAVAYKKEVRLEGFLFLVMGSQYRSNDQFLFLRL